MEVSFELVLQDLRHPIRVAQMRRAVVELAEANETITTTTSAATIIDNQYHCHQCQATAVKTIIKEDEQKERRTVAPYFFVEKNKID